MHDTTRSLPLFGSVVSGWLRYVHLTHAALSLCVFTPPLLGPLLERYDDP
ncbi:MAG: hypothetical protein H0T64_12205 [Pyrinomonadaceae bacterium]|nr:hypothetical protein [Pyrinomonadaceae bacterium]